MTAEKLRVCLIDDHDLLRRGIKTMLETEPDIVVVGEASDGREAAELVEQTTPDVVLLDVVMPHKDGIEATREIKEAWPTVGIIVLSGHDERQFVLDALKAGASGYLLKTADLDELVDAIRKVAYGGRLDSDHASDVLAEFDRFAAVGSVGFQPLTALEKEILTLIAEGLPSKSIARRLAIAERTVTTHIANIYSKLHVNNRVSAIQEAMRRRLIGPKS
ncbi:MAG TPA: response regulator transcription factor [Actinomycetota bacterium]|nr:response regulator transcription factor [Actinomycetota bacterium]